MSSLSDRIAGEIVAKPFFSVGLKAFILNPEQKLLLIKRAGNNVIPDRWDVPGGRMSFGESLDEALKREIHEEVGLELERIGTVLNVSTFFHVKVPENQIVRVIFSVTTKGHQVVLSGEHQEYEWVDLMNVHQYPLYSAVLETAVTELQSIVRDGDSLDLSIVTKGFLN